MLNHSYYAWLSLHRTLLALALLQHLGRDRKSAPCVAHMSCQGLAVHTTSRAAAQNSQKPIPWIQVCALSKQRNLTCRLPLRSDCQVVVA
ncbi:uncharacterized protein BJ171DRAFT_524417 [Polychytrium aggregatum]|uniref:uncharacterized protein n=1 Tax=Polychytrium aggregatum TaxID=110093 RepID=UPI0022FE9400|nr:uncharacterized protein BJ171DRAFT_524417 [Polychytrium aggregatum]KAI9193747.1 hypothetical protein BJ171DRAFT_524417 [Polychytrium aggregatum]